MQKQDDKNERCSNVETEMYLPSMKNKTKALETKTAIETKIFETTNADLT